MLNSVTQLQFANSSWSNIRLNQGWFISWLVMLAALAGTITQVDEDTGVLSAVLRSVSSNKVLWICLGIAFWHLQRLRSAPLGWLDMFAAIPAIAFSLFFSGSLAWGGLLFSLILFSRLKPFGASQAGLWIAIASSSQVLVTTILSQLGGDGLLRLEAQMVGLLAQPFVGELTVQGSALLGAQGHTLVLVWGCSAFSNLGFSMLLFFALITLRFSEKTISQQKIWMAGYFLLVSMAVVAINLARLSLMMGGPEFFEYMHEGDGSGLVRVITLGCIALLGFTVSLNEKTS